MVTEDTTWLRSLVQSAVLQCMFFVQVDLFVNYDCDLQAANLFERTLRGLARIVRGGESAPGMLHAMGPVVNVNAAARPKPHQLAADVALWVIRALDTWAEPLKVCILFSNTANTWPLPSLMLQKLRLTDGGKG